MRYLWNSGGETDRGQYYEIAKKIFVLKKQILLMETIKEEIMKDNNKVLDLCHMTIEDTKRINELFDKYSVQYTEFMDDLSSGHDRCEFWWATAFASRNVYLSETYWNICIVLYAIERIRNDAAIEVIETDKREIATTLSIYLRGKKGLSNLKVKCLSEKKPVDCKLALLYDCYKTIFRKYKIKRKINKLCKNQYISQQEEIVLIEENIITASCMNGKFSSRDFTNLLEYTNEKIYVLPHICAEDKNEYWEIVQYLNNDENYHFLFRENFVNMFDYIKILQYPLLCVKWGKENYNFGELDVSAIVKADLLQGIGLPNSINALLGYYAINNMKKKKVKIKALVGWWEGQPSSIGLFLAYRQKYPGGRSTGYIGIPTDEKYISRYPSKEQMRQKATPEAISVISDVYKNMPCKYADNVRVKLCPSFRINIANKLDENEGKQKIIFCALPITAMESQKIICMLEAVSQTLHDYLIILKNHPYNQKWKLEDYNVKKVNFKYIFSTDSFEKLVNSAQIVITSSPSTTGAEALLHGKKAIVIAAPGRIVASCIPNSIPDYLWRVVYNEKELEEAISDLTIQNVSDDKVFNLVEINEMSVKELFR